MSFQQQQPQQQQQQQPMPRAGTPPPDYGTLAAPPPIAKVTLANTANASTTVKDQYDWQFFLNVSTEALPFVKQVDVHLHPSFNPAKFSLKASDISADDTFRLPQLTGWGVFEVTAIVHWESKIGGTSTFKHMLQFDSPLCETCKTVDLSKTTATAPATPKLASVSTLSSRGIQQQPPQTQQQQTQQLPRALKAYGNRAAKAREPMPAINTDKAPNDKHTLISMVVDRSGSMKSMGSEVEGGCNAYLDEQRKADVMDMASTTVLLTTFDSKIERVIDGADLTTIDAITHEQIAPRGSTALYDGIGETLRRTIELANSLDTMPAVAVFILTDGQENASQQWDEASVSAEITRLQAEPYNWDFYFAAANQDAMAAGTSMGLDSGRCMQWGFEGAKMSSAMTSANRAYQRKKQGHTKGEFTEYERMACA